MAIKSKNIHAAAEFAKKFWAIDVERAAGTTVSTLSIAALILPFACVVEAVKVYTRRTTGVATVDVRQGGTSVLSAPVTVPTTASTSTSGVIADASIDKAAVLDVVVTQGSTEAVYATVIVQYRPYLSSPERISAGLADES